MKNIRQLGRTDCGETCLAGISEFYGKAISVTQIRRITSPGEQGASLAELQYAAQQLGFQAAPVRGTYEALTRATLPAIVHLDSPQTGAHYVVVEQVALQHIGICDPADGKKHYWSRAQFEHYWSGAAMLLLPGPRFQETDRIPIPLITHLILQGLRKVRHQPLQFVVLALLLMVLSGSSAQAIPDLGLADKPEIRYSD